MTVKLQGIYNKQEAKAVKELKTGDVIMWNYGYTSTVVDLIPSKTGRQVIVFTINGKYCCCLSSFLAIACPFQSVCNPQYAFH